jgi:hypothetical protein
VSNLEWDAYMSILRDRSDDPSVWARNKLQQMADRIHALTAERDEARREILLWVKERCSWVELTEEIKQRGWEYLKEDGK